MIILEGLDGFCRNISINASGSGIKIS